VQQPTSGSRIVRLLLYGRNERARSFWASALRAEGFTVDALGKNEGLPDVAGRGYSVVVLDPVLAGDQTIRLVHEVRGTWPRVPLIVMASCSSIQSRMPVKGVTCVIKPVTVDELLERIRLHLRRTHPAEAMESMSSGHLVLEVTHRQARIGDVVVDLPDREFRLLRYLLVKHGEVVTRQRLLAEVWGYDSDPRSNVVDVCIRRLRRRLGPAAPIETVRNIGYRTVAVGVTARNDHHDSALTAIRGRLIRGDAGDA
jgi:two-component system, OmpR family, copper resistance phosphate regulon response regulator CusR